MTPESENKKKHGYHPRSRDSSRTSKVASGEGNEAIKEEQAMGLSKGEMALRQLVVDKVPGAEPDELSSLLNKVVTEHTFSGWQVQPSIHATIKRDFILELAKHAKEHPEVDLNPDDYSMFSQEAMKYVERHF